MENEGRRILTNLLRGRTARCLLPGPLVLWGACAGAAVQVSVPETITAAPGQTFQVPVSLGAASGVLGYNFEFAYSSQFEYVGVRSGPLTTSWSALVVNAIAGRCNVAGYGVNPVSGPGVLVILTFRVLPAAPMGWSGACPSGPPN